MAGDSSGKKTDWAWIVGLGITMLFMAGFFAWAVSNAASSNLEQNSTSNIATGIMTIMSLGVTLVLLSYYFLDWNVAVIVIIFLLTFVSMVIGMYEYEDGNRPASLDITLAVANGLCLLISGFIIFMIYKWPNQMSLKINPNGSHYIMFGKRQTTIDREGGTCDYRGTCGNYIPEFKFDKQN